MRFTPFEPRLDLASIIAGAATAFLLISGSAEAVTYAARTMVTITPTGKRIEQVERDFRAIAHSMGYAQRIGPGRRASEIDDVGYLNLTFSDNRERASFHVRIDKRDGKTFGSFGEGGVREFTANGRKERDRFLDYVFQTFGKDAVHVRP